MDIRFDATHDGRVTGEESHIWPGTPAGIPFVTRQYRYAVAITPAPGALANPTDGIMVSANANVTFTSADDPDAAPMTLALVAGVQYDLSVAKVTVVSAGTAVALYHRKP